MAQKNIYIREEHLPVFEEATRVFGKKGLGAVLYDLLRHKLPSLEDEAFQYLMMKKADLNFFSQLIEYYLQKEYPPEVIVEQQKNVDAVEWADPDFWESKDLITDLEEILFWGDNDAVFKKWKQLAQEGREITELIERQWNKMARELGRTAAFPMNLTSIRDWTEEQLAVLRAMEKALSASTKQGRGEDRLEEEKNGTAQ